MTRCHDCQAQLLFVALLDDQGRPTGKSMPIDPRPNPEGTVAAVRVGGRLEGHVLSGSRPLQEGQTRYVTHHATCHRKADRVPRPRGLFDEGAGRG